MADYKFKKGDRAHITGDPNGPKSCSVFNTGDEVWILQDDDVRPYVGRNHDDAWGGKSSGKCGHIHQDEMELIEEPQYKKLSPKVGDKFRVVKPLKGKDTGKDRFTKGEEIAYVEDEWRDCHKFVNKKTHWLIREDCLTTEYLEPVGETATTAQELRIKEQNYYHNKPVWLGKGQIEAINESYEQIIKDWLLPATKQTTMSRITKFVKDLTLSEPKKSYIKYGLMTEQGEYTEDVRELAMTELVDAHIATTDFQEKLGQFVEEQKADKK